MAKKIQKLQIARHAVQLIFFILLPGLYTLTFTELKSVYKMLTSGNFHFIQAVPALGEFIIVILFTVLMGRFFCGWMCAFGAYNDFIHLISKKIFKVNFKVDEKVDAVLKYVKYIILLMLLIVTVTMGSTILQGTSPWDAFAQITDFSTVLSTMLVGLVLLVLITIGAFFIERFFCRYLCPLGAVFSLISRFGIFKINKPTDKCGKCRACTSVCSMGIPLYKMEKVKGGECIECMKCVEICPRKNATANVIGEDVNPALASSVAIATFAGVYGITNLTSAVLTKSGIASTSSIVSSSKNKASANYKDGTYTGTGTGFRGGTTEVSVTIKNGQITSVETVSSQDTPNYYNRASGTIVNEILSAQSTDVDTVSGATFSSNGIIEAVKNALSNATGATSSNSTDSNSSSATDSNSSNSTNSSANDTADNSKQNDGSSNSEQGKAETGINNDTSNNATNNNSSNGNTSSSNQASSNDSQSSSQNSAASSGSSTNSTAVKYKDGTYTGTGTGFRGGTTEISVTIKDGKITAVSTVSSQDTPNYYNYAENTIQGEVIQAQSASVDTVSGATFSSRGILEAIQNALTKAQ